MNNNISFLEVAATTCFALAVLHTFSVKWFRHWASHFPEGSVAENILHLIGEVEVVFGLWAGILVLIIFGVEGRSDVTAYLDARDFTEPTFVFVVLTICSSRPLLHLTSQLIEFVSLLMPGKKSISFYFTALTLGPLLGSFITEPAAMTVTALILLNRFYSQGISKKLMYATLGLLFVNISIGGVLTPYAAPPVLMVASKWNWNLPFMLSHFGWKGAIASLLSTLFVTFRFRRELSNLPWNKTVETAEQKNPVWLSIVHLLFLFLIVFNAHHTIVFIGLFLFFMGFVNVTKEYQTDLKLKEGLLVAFFLGGLVVLGGAQRWWLEPLLRQLTTLPLYLGAISLTAFTDNAALTYLGSQVPDLSEASKYFLVAGSIVGGGLTVIANAPNPAGYSILNSSFGDEGISAFALFTNALIPTVISALCFWFL